MFHATAAELIAYTSDERARWRRWFAHRPEALAAPVQPEGRFASIGDLIDHIFLVERRHLQRLTRQAPLAESTGVATTDAEVLFGYGEAVRADFTRFVSTLEPVADESIIEIDIRGTTCRMTARRLVMHILLHDIRHWAQIALAVRLAGFAPPGNHDLFYSSAIP